jgi:LDH2 family malate/lactate/ureidoglycolate dehydrogenase
MGVAMTRPVNVARAALEEFASGILTAARCSAEEAHSVARNLVWADLHGREAQGVFRLSVLVEMITHGIITSPSRMTWSEQAPSIHHLDAGNGFGQIAGEKGMKRAVELAKAFGIGMVTVNNSNHYGAASFYCSLAADEGCLGMTTCNATPKVAPLGGTRAVFGTNPLALGSPTSGGDPILVDFSTSAIAGSTIRALKERGGSLPAGVALDSDGKPTVDPKALSTGSLLSAAGPKGYGLGMMIEIMSGVLSSAGMSHEVGPFYQTWERQVNSGHTFLAMDIGCFVPLETYYRRVDDLLAAVKSSPLQEGYTEILYPGEIRGRLARQYDREGIPLSPETVSLLGKLSARLGVTPPWTRD